MTQTAAPSTSTATRFLPLVMILFAGSGCSALIYEIVWYQLLQLGIGSTQVSLGILLATFMGGLCIGSLWLPRMKWAKQHPLKVYAKIEAAIGVCGLLALFAIPLASQIYWSAAPGGLFGMLLRGLVAAVCMLVPTALMGASLPAIARWVESSSQGMSWWGLLYAGNTLGAVAGCLLAGFYLLRVYDTAIATYVAVAINLMVAALSWWLQARVPAVLFFEPSAFEQSAFEAPASPAIPPAVASPQRIYWAIAISGACALGAEVVWTRLLGMLLGATVYVFAIILAVFLVGLAIGSGLASTVIGRISARAALGWCQLLLVLAIAWAAAIISNSLPYWPIDTFLEHNPWAMFQLDLVRCLWALLPAAILWGASMPLACAAAAGSNDDAGFLVGRVYAANTLGAIVGALATSLILVPWIGTQNTQRLMLLLSAVGGAVVLLEASKKFQTNLALAGLVIAALLARTVNPVPGALIAYGRRMPVYKQQSTILYTAEGRNSSIAIGRYPNGSIEIDVNGHVEATTEIYDMKLQRMVGHLPGMLHPNAKSVLGIGFGAGVSAGTFTRYPGIEKITICEIEPMIPPTSTRFFAPQNYEVFKNPKTHVVFDDARHFLMTTKEKYDIIASDPLDVFVKGTAALYSLEYFEAVKRHLKPGGMFTLYVPLYESDLATVKSELATFFAAFPYSSVWANNRSGAGYDMVFMGQMDPLKIDVDQVQARLERPDYAAVAESLRDIGVHSAAGLFSVYTGANADLGEWTKGSVLNRDRDLKLMYMAGWGINSNLADTIYRDMLRYRKAEQHPFTGSPASIGRVQSAMMSAASGSPYTE